MFIICNAKICLFVFILETPNDGGEIITGMDHSINGDCVLTTLDDFAPRQNMEEGKIKTKKMKF